MEWKQQLYDLKRQLAQEQATRRFLEEDNEILQKEIKTKEKDLENCIRSSKEKSHQNEILLTELEAKLKSVEELREEERKSHNIAIENLVQQLNAAKTNLDSHESGSLSLSQELKKKNEILEKDFENLKLEYEIINNETNALRRRLEELLESREDVNNALHSTREELSSYIEKCNALQEEVALLKVEIDSFKADPRPHSTRGNSVFAEVDDNRKALKNNLDKLAYKYKYLNRECKSKNLELMKLRAEKSSLLSKLLDISNQHRNMESDLIDSYKTRIQDLENMIEYFKKEIESCHNFSGDYVAIGGMFAMKNKTIENLMEKVNLLSSKVLLQDETLFSLRKDLEVQSYKSAIDHSENLLLKEKLKNNEIFTEN